jgi:putative transposase
MLRQHGGNVRFVWNKLLDYSNTVKKNSGKYPTQSELQKHILVLKKANDFLRISHSQPIQVNAQKLVKTFIRAFNPQTISERNKKIALAQLEKNEELRKRKLARAFGFGFPKFKSKSNCNDNLFYPQAFKIKKSRIYFPKVGWLQYIKHRKIEGTPLFLSIVQDGNDQYYVSITSEVNIEEKQKVALDQVNQANIVGIDVGLKTFAVLSDGTEIENPKTLKKHLNKLRKESKILSRKSYDEVTKKSSNNRIKQISKVQKAHRKVRNIRKNFLHKTTHHIITKYDGVIMENLDIKGMLKKNSRAMNRSVTDVSWYEFGRQLEYKSIWNSKHFCKIDRFFPSTQKCSECGNEMSLSLSDRTYSCPNCKAVLGRDSNASLNIRNEGIRTLTLNTLATKGFKACGSGTLVLGVKQEKLKYQTGLLAHAV